MRCLFFNACVRLVRMTFKFYTRLFTMFFLVYDVVLRPLLLNISELFITFVFIVHMLFLLGCFVLHFYVVDDALSFSICMRFDALMVCEGLWMSSSRVDPIVLQQLERLLEDVLESDWLLSEKLNYLTMRVPSIHEKYAELQASIGSLYACYDGQKDIKFSFYITL
ncbi:hypothetical protein Hdeb2414_s0016g00490261 [Helianthus debilis subsp. tardiflorus]